MSWFERVARTEDHPGEPVSAYGVTVTPWARATVLCLPFARIIWNRPIAVEVIRSGETTRRPIVDLNRISWLAWLACLIFAVRVTAGLAKQPARKEMPL